MLRENHSSVPVAGLLFRWQGTVKHSEDSAEEKTTHQERKRITCNSTKQVYTGKV